MDRRERSGDLLAGLLALQENWFSTLYVAMPGIVQSFDASKRTCVIQPAVKAQVMNEKGEKQWVMMPLLLDCPVVFPGGGDVVLTFPLKQGDEVLVIFSDRCIDAWWQSGGIQAQAELRMHDLSDGYCMPGPSSIPRVEASIDTAKATLRSRDGQAVISLDPATHTISAAVQGGPTMVHDATKYQVTFGNVSFKVDATGVYLSDGAAGSPAELKITAGMPVLRGGSVQIQNKDFLSHHHSGVSTGGGQTGNVV